MVMSEANDVEKLVKETVKCTFTISCRDRVMLDTCMMKMMEAQEGKTARRCPVCDSIMEYYGSYWECPNCLHKILVEEEEGFKQR